MLVMSSRSNFSYIRYELTFNRNVKLFSNSCTVNCSVPKTDYNTFIFMSNASLMSINVTHTKAKEHL